MAIELGALLGQFKGSQSFEQIGSWDDTTSATWIDVNTSTNFVHSSTYAGLTTVINVGGVGGGFLKYNYTASNDVYGRWWYGTGSHTLVSYFWNYLPNAVSSGAVTAYLNSESALLTVNSEFERYRLETTLNSADIYELRYEFTTPASGFAHVSYFDDILTAVDVIELCPERSLQFRDELFIGQHQTIGGANPSYRWGHNKKWNLPLEYVSENNALLLNQWWQDARPLLFTWDTSDTTQQFIVTMTNNQTPMNQFNQPYHDNWRGNLELSAFDTSLVF